MAGSFRADGTAKYTTVWVALSAATTDNSCLYLVPRQYDPGYIEGDDHSTDAEDPLILTLRRDAAVQSLRACPLRPGGAVIFTHRAMHWGSTGQSQCEKARISVSRPIKSRSIRQLPSVGPNVCASSALHADLIWPLRPQLRGALLSSSKQASTLPKGLAAHSSCCSTANQLSREVSV